MRSSMNIIIEPHTILLAKERSASYNEIIDKLINGINSTAKNNRLVKAKSLILVLSGIVNSKKKKKLKVYNVIENNNIIAVTAYVFYGSF